MFLSNINKSSQMNLAKETDGDSYKKGTCPKTIFATQKCSNED